MKNFLKKILAVGIIGAVLLGVVSLFSQSLNPSNVSLAWNYPSNQDNTLAFVLSQTTNLNVPFSNWTTAAVVAASNCSPYVTTNGQYCYTYDTYLTAGAYFFVVQASNFWGLSATSNAALTPPPAFSISYLGIQHLTP